MESDNKPPQPAIGIVDSPRPSHPWSWLQVLALLGVILASGVAIRMTGLWRTEHRGVPILVDPDSVLHLYILEEGLRTGSLRVPVIADDNAPFGRVNEWTLANTVALRAGTLVTGTDEKGLRRLALWFGPTVSVLTMLAPALLAFVNGRRRLGLAWAASMALMPWVASQGPPGFLDQSALQTALLAGLCACVMLARDRPTAALGAVAGAAEAYLFWLGSTEHTAIFLLVASLAAFDVVMADQSRLPFWRAWWITGSASLAAMLLIEGAPLPIIDRLHPIHLLAWLGGGGVLEAARAGTSFGGRSARLAFGAVLHVAVLAICAGWVRGFDWAHLSVLQDPDFARHRHVIEEYRSLGEWPMRGLQHLVRQVGLLPLAPAALLLIGERRASRLWWVTIVSGAFLVLSYDAVRWLRLGSVMLPIVVIGAVADAPFTLRSRILAIGVMICAPLGETIYSTREEIAAARTRPAAATIIPGAIAALGRDLAASGPSTKPIILAPLGFGPYLLHTGRARSISSQYWSNIGGMRAAAEIYTETDDARFLARLRDRRVDFILIPGESIQLSAIAGAFNFVEGRDPDMAQVEATRIRRLERTAAPMRVQTPELDRAAPGWNLIRVP